MGEAMKAERLVRVKKFGGTSVGSIERIEDVAKRVLESQKAGESPVLVVSAMSGETNRLVGLAETVNPGYRGVAYDMLLASGEQVSISLLAMAIERLGGKAKPFLAHQLGIYTDSMFSKAKITKIDSSRILKEVEEGVIPIVAGFQGMDSNFNVTTLGRGGSDTTAVALAAALEADACEIFTDVPAVFSADPRLVPKAREISRLSFEEMVEMASLGSKVLHIRSVEIAAKYGVKLHVRSTFEKREGTWVLMEDDMMENPVVTAVTHDASTAVIKLFPMPDGTSVLAELFEMLSKKGIVVDIITQSHKEDKQRLAFSIPNEEIRPTLSLVSEFLSEAEAEVIEDVAKISIVGVGMRNHPGVAAQFFRTLADFDIPIHLVTTSEIKVSAVIDSKHLDRAANGLHTAFGLDV